jgi:hypothetical protein
MSHRVTLDVKLVNFDPRHSFAQIDHQIAALSQENRQARLVDSGREYSTRGRS